MIVIRFVVAALLLIVTANLQAQIYDNRFFPWYKRPYSRTVEAPSRTLISPFFVMAKKSLGAGINNDTRLFEIFGTYDQNKVREAIIAIGGPDFFNNPVLQDLKGRDVIWRMNGKLFGQGIALTVDQDFNHHLSGGFSCFFMHLFTRSLFVLNSANLIDSPDDEIALDIVRRAMDSYLGIENSRWKKVGFSDIECYLRLGNIWEYMWKFRRIDAGFRLGGLIPTGTTRNINNPASVPFGGNGHWGVYIAADCQLELKEDFSVGLLAQYNQRFEKNDTLRIPAANEQQLFGAIVGPVEVDPNATLIFAPYVMLENIREGFGLRGQYTAVVHFEDSFTDKRPFAQPPVTVTSLIKKSDWVAEYFTVDAFYDFGNLWQDHCASLLITAMVDVPTKWLIGESAIKTTRVSLGVQLTY